MSRAPTPTPPLVTISGLSLTISSNTILDSISLDILPGELLAVIGPNGAGKSSAIKCLGGIETEWKGGIELEGRAFDRWSAHDRARKIAYLPQFFSPHWELTVADLLNIGQERGQMALGFGGMGGPSVESIDVAHQSERLLQDLELTDFLNRRFASLSGGERARALLAQALVTSPSLLLADEPIASLDPAHQLRTMQYLREIRRETASLVVLHDLNLALRFADRIAVMANGKVMACDTSDAIVSSGILSQVFSMDFDTYETSWGRALLPR